MTAERKREVIAEFGASEKDTGTSEVQIALLTSRIDGTHRAPERHTRKITIVAEDCSS